MVFVVKVSYKGDVRRTRFPSVADVKFEDISCMVAESFGLSTYTAKYQDEEGDWCTATPQTFLDALELSAATNSLRLEIEAEPCSCTSDVSSDCSWEEVNFRAELDDSVTETDSQVIPRRPQEQEATGPEDSAESHKESGDSSQKMPAQQETAKPSEEHTVPPPSEEHAAASPSEEHAAPPPSEEHAMPPPSEEHAASSSSGYHAPPPRAVTHSWYASDEKIQIVLAAFDADDDGHLNFEESNELQRFVAGDQMPLEVYKTLCAELEVIESKGPGTKELEILYEKFGTLERDFEAALRKIEGGTEMQAGWAQTSPRSQSSLP